MDSGSPQKTRSLKYDAKTEPQVRRPRQLVGAFGSEARYYAAKEVKTRSVTAKGHEVQTTTKYEVTNARRPVKSVSQRVKNDRVVWVSLQGSGYAPSKNGIIKVVGD